MALKDEIYKCIKEEIVKDPEGVGYAGKTVAEILQLLNNPVKKQRIVEDTFPAPINRILTGLPDTPNIITLQDVVDAQK